MKAIGYLLLVTVICVPLLALAGTTGKIVGTARDARTGEPLPSVNVVVEGSNLGAASNVDGYFVILNVPPGRCRVIASLVGYKSASAVDVRVDIDQTTTQNFSLAEETVTTEEVTVVAQRPVVQRDVAASRANIEIKEVEKLPVATVVGAVGLQAGVQGLSIRGGTAAELAFMVNGTMMRDERTNTPYTSVSLLSVQDIQVTTGGFSAEYGQVRSGVVNVVTKEGGRSNYTVAFLGRYLPHQPQAFRPLHLRQEFLLDPPVPGRRRRVDGDPERRVGPVHAEAVPRVRRVERHLPAVRLQHQPERRPDPAGSPAPLRVPAAQDRGGQRAGL